MFDDESERGELLSPPEPPVMPPWPQAIPATSRDGLLATEDASIGFAAKMARVSPRLFACAVAGRRRRFFGCRTYHQASLVERSIGLRRITLSQQRVEGFAGGSAARIRAISRGWRSRLFPWAAVAAS